MHRNTSSLRTQLKRIGLALVLGVVLCLLSTALLLTYLKSWSWVSSGPTLNPDSFEATYLEPIAPELVAVRHHSPSTGNGSFALTGINLGADMVSYCYGVSLWDEGYTPWDPTVDAEPTSVNIMRYRFGWPMRMLHYDDISTGSSIADPIVLAYHQRANAIAGIHRGLDRPSWLPGFIPLYRVPIAVNWFTLVINVLTWSALCYALMSCLSWLRAWIQRRRIKGGLCASCKYPVGDFERCPECGTEIRIA